jgi:membrane protein
MALLGETLEELLACGVLSQVKSDGAREAMYLPGLDPQRISIQLVMDRLDQNGSQDLPLPPSDTLERITESLEQFRRVVQSSPANLLLKDI